MPTARTERPAHLRALFALDALVRAMWPGRWGAAVPWAMLLPALALVLILVAGMGYMLDNAFRELDRTTFRLAEHYSLSNFERIAEHAAYARIIGRTVLAATVVTLAALVLAFPYAYVIVRAERATARKALLAALLLPFFVGQVVRAYGWLVVLGHQGLLNTLLGAAGLGRLELLYTYPGVLLGLVQYMLPFAVLMMIPAITAIPREMEMASEGLGARWWSTLRHVVLPMAKPGFVAAGVVVFTLTLTDFAMPEVMGGGRTDFMANAVYEAFFSISDAGLGSALAVLLVLLGSTLVGLIFALVGVGTLGYVQRAEQ